MSFHFFVLGQLRWGMYINIMVIITTVSIILLFLIIIVVIITIINRFHKLLYLQFGRLFSIITHNCLEQDESVPLNIEQTV